MKGCTCTFAEQLHPQFSFTPGEANLLFQVKYYPKSKSLTGL